MRLPQPLSLLVCLIPAVVPAQQPAGEEPQALIRKAIEVHGGPDKLDRLRQVREKSSGTLRLLDMKVTFTSETVQRLPGQFRHTLVSEIPGKKLNSVQVFDGKSGWLSENGITRAIDARTLEGWKATAHAAYVSSLTPLLAADKGYTLALAPAIKVEGKPARGVKVSAPGERDVYLYFDNATGLLVKKRFHPHPVPESIQEEVYCEFKDVNGLKRPTKVIISLNGAPQAEAAIRSIDFLERVDDKEFAKP